jgi:hypothetical protein
MRSWVFPDLHIETMIDSILQWSRIFFTVLTVSTTTTHTHTHTQTHTQTQAHTHVRLLHSYHTDSYTEYFVPYLIDKKSRSYWEIPLRGKMYPSLLMATFRSMNKDLDNSCRLHIYHIAGKIIRIFLWVLHILRSVVIHLVDMHIQQF